MCVSSDGTYSDYISHVRYRLEVSNPHHVCKWYNIRAKQMSDTAFAGRFMNSTQNFTRLPPVVCYLQTYQRKLNIDRL